MKHFNWMVFDSINRDGIWFKETKENGYCVFYWNPIKNIKSIIRGEWEIGFFPLSTKHINW